MSLFRIADPISMRGLLLRLALSLAICTPVSAQNLQPEKPASRVVHGTVINAVTQAPIPRALVVSGDNHVAVFTDGQGHFEVTPPGEQSSSGIHVGLRSSTSFSARKPGFLSDGRRPTFAPQSDDLIIALTPEAIIKGRITLTSGEPSLDIGVQLYSRRVMHGFARWQQGPMVRTNSAGEFRFAELEPGSYKLVTHEHLDNDPVTNIPGSQQSASQQSGSQQYGYPPVYFPGASEFSSASTIDLAAGQEFEADLSLTRQPYYRVRVPAVNSEGIAGLVVSIQGQRGPGYTLRYNGSERRIEGLLPNGNYMVEASTFGQGSLNGSVAIRVAGAPIEGPPITLVPNGSVPIQVREQFSQASWNGHSSWNFNGKMIPIHGPRVYLNVTAESADDFTQQHFGSIRPPADPNDETLVLENLPPGQYWLQLNTARGYIASATQGSTDVLHKLLTVGSGPSAPIEVTVRDDTAELDGTVTALSQQTASSADASEPMQVSVVCVPLPDNPGAFMQVGVSGDGKFTFANMAPGDYRILAFSNPDSSRELPYRDPEAMKAYDSKGTVVHLTAGQKTTVQVQTILSE